MNTQFVTDYKGQILNLLIESLILFKFSEFLEYYIHLLPLPILLLQGHLKAAFGLLVKMPTFHIQCLSLLPGFCL